MFCFNLENYKYFKVLIWGEAGENYQHFNVLNWGEAGKSEKNYKDIAATGDILLIFFNILKRASADLSLLLPGLLDVSVRPFVRKGRHLYNSYIFICYCGCA